MEKDRLVSFFLFFFRSISYAINRKGVEWEGERIRGVNKVVRVDRSIRKELYPPFHLDL